MFNAARDEGVRERRDTSDKVWREKGHVLGMGRDRTDQRYREGEKGDII